MNDLPEQPMNTHEFYGCLFLLRLDVYFAAQRYNLEVEALTQLKTSYGGQVPKALWEKQRSRVLRAQIRLGVRRSALTIFLKPLLN
ncbi:MAG: hypothetical protein IT324_06885 [Anaerolineae bacterium]|nr:hypothetical protein [Anaerolineae bacterium]